MAVLIHEDAYDQLLTTHFALHRPVADRGRKLVGPKGERYVTTGGEGAKCSPEVCYLLEIAQ